MIILVKNAKVIFNDSDSNGWGQGVIVTLLRKLNKKEADKEVGPMYRIRREDGAEKDAFLDELTLTA